MTPIASSLQQTVSLYATQIYADTLLDAQLVLEEHQYTDHELPLINILETTTGSELVLAVHDCLYSALLSVCSFHRIGINDLTPIFFLSRFTRALLLMQYWSDGDTIIKLCESDADDEDIFSGLAELVGELTRVQVNDILESIDPNYLRGLKKLYTPDVSVVEEQTDSPIPEQQLIKLRQWRSLMAAEKSLGFRMVKLGYKPGFKLESYLNRVVNILVERENKEIAFEVLVFILLSSDGWENPLKAWRDNNSIFNLELRDVTTIDVEIIKLIGDFNRLNNQGVKP